MKRMKGGKNKVGNNAISIVLFKKNTMSKHRRNNYLSPRCCINFPISRNKLSHEQLVFSLLHHLDVYFPAWLY